MRARNDAHDQCIQESEDEREEEDELQRLDATRLLTAEEFEKIRKLRAKRELETSMGKNSGPDAESLQVFPVVPPAPCRLDVQPTSRSSVRGYCRAAHARVLVSAGSQH